MPDLTYSTAHGNARSLTQWARPGVKSTSSWVLAGFIIAEPRWELCREYSKILMPCLYVTAHFFPHMTLYFPRIDYSVASVFLKIDYEVCSQDSFFFFFLGVGGTLSTSDALRILLIHLSFFKPWLERNFLLCWIPSRIRNNTMYVFFFGDLYSGTADFQLHFLDDV